MRELSADVRAAIVLDGAGRLLAGPPELTDPARALLAAGGNAVELEAAGEDGVACAVRSADHAAVAVCGRFAIAGVVRQDLRAALAAIEGRAPGSDAPLAPLDEPVRDAAETPRRDAVEAPPADALERAAEALISAVQRGFDA
ncbi:MAG TPA: hypothetical protein VKA57_05400 [Solirubrobacteraceae bacterium]|nr:hypothetical protein [Solirubrobacteraceae bacterium]